YLEHGEISLVRESLRERERLLRERPHLVRSLEFVLAVPRHFFGRRSALAIRTGLWLYGLAAGVRHCTAAPARAQAVRDLESALDKGLNLEFYPYEDAQCEYPERLVGEWLAGAMEDGAVARNYTRVLAVEAAEGRAR